MTTYIDSPKHSGTGPESSGELARDEKTLLKQLTGKRPHSLNASEKRLLVVLLAKRLAVGLGVMVASSRLEVYSEQLADLDRDELVSVFSNAERECRFFPSIPELRGMVGKLESQSELMSIDQAWLWVTTYIEKHGIEGHDYVVAKDLAPGAVCEKCKGTRWIVSEVEVERKDGTKVKTRGAAMRCDCRTVALREQAPQIPPRINATLRCLAPSVETALEGIRDCEGKWAARLRDGFNDAYKRAGNSLEVG